MTGEYSLSDIAAATGGNNSGFGNGGDGWWIILLFIFIAAFGGWGNNGGFGGSGSGYVSDNYALVTDNATLERKIDGVYSGICDATFNLSGSLNNGFASAQNTMTQGFAGLNTALVQQGYEGRIATQGVGSQLAQCCCDLRQQVSDVNYKMADQANVINNEVRNGFCQTNYNNATNTRDIIESQNAGTRAILDAINANKVEALKERIAEQNQTITALNLAASQQAQNNYLVDKLGPHSPVSAYVVQPPQQITWPTSCCGQFNCGCQQNALGTTIA